MARELCILSGPVTATKIKHYLVKGSYANRELFSPPRFVVIDDGPEPPVDPRGSGVMMYRFDANGDCVGDTWHESLDDAKRDAANEYEGLVQSWEEIPTAADMVDFGLTKLNASTEKK